MVGCGAMGAALLKGWLGSYLFLEKVVVIAPQRSSVEPFMQDHRVEYINDPKDLPFKPDVFVFAVKPQIMAELVPFYKDHIQGALILSIAAGLSLDFYQHFSNGSVIRAMPNTPAQVFEGITGLVANDQTSQEQKDIAEGLMGCVGEVVWLHRDELMDLVTALSGCGPAYYYLLTEVLAKVAEHHGLACDVAEKLARQTLIGAGAYLQESRKSPDGLRREVTSKGGMTEAAMDILLDPAHGLEGIFNKAFESALRRAKDLRGEK